MDDDVNGLRCWTCSAAARTSRLRDERKEQTTISGTRWTAQDSTGVIRATYNRR